MPHGVTVTALSAADAASLERDGRDKEANEARAQDINFAKVRRHLHDRDGLDELIGDHRSFGPRSHALLTEWCRTTLGQLGADDDKDRP